jgi:ubiquinone biosynthesis protein UbiJ
MQTKQKISKNLGEHMKSIFSQIRIDKFINKVFQVCHSGARLGRRTERSYR